MRYEKAQKEMGSDIDWIGYRKVVSCETLVVRKTEERVEKDDWVVVFSITYITLSYYVTFLTYTYNSCKYIYKKISLSLILSIICNALCNFMQPLAHKGVYNDLL